MPSVDWKPIWLRETPPAATKRKKSLTSRICFRSHPPFRLYLESRPKSGANACWARAGDPNGADRVRSNSSWAASRRLHSSTLALRHMLCGRRAFRQRRRALSGTLRPNPFTFGLMSWSRPSCSGRMQVKTTPERRALQKHVVTTVVPSPSGLSFLHRL